VFDKENSIEFLLDSVYYLYMKSNPNPSFYPVLPYESLFACVFINKKIKEKKNEKKNNNQKLKRKEKKRKINNDLVILPSHDINIAEGRTIQKLGNLRRRVLERDKRNRRIHRGRSERSSRTTRGRLCHNLAK